MAYLMPNPFLWKNSRGTIQPKAGGDKSVHAFQKGISLKVNIIAWLEFELTYHDIAVQHH